MNKHTTIDQGQQRVVALQQEAARLADQAKDQLADYARKFDVSKQTKIAKSAVQDGREHIQQAASDASEQVTAAMAVALEEAAGRLRNYNGTGPAAQVANSAAGALEYGSEKLQPWATRSILRRLTRVVRNYPLPTLLIVVGAVGAAVLTNRGRNAE
ncbi:MAG: hypothetical protein SH847_05270 [Roseiflexaceae bacterium]|nr:hypothetical protein [Roseiflexaceae bacterium]